MKQLNNLRNKTAKTRRTQRKSKRSVVGFLAVTLLCWGVGSGEWGVGGIAFANTNPIPDSLPPTHLSQADEPEQLPVTSVDALSDVKPTDWAYQALKTLMEKYGVLSGFADGTFRGNRPVNRYEFAAGLNAVLDKVDSLIVDAIGDRYIQDDIITLRRLEEEYRDVLNQMRKSLDNLEARNAQLQGNQFSTTTKLQGESIFALTDGSAANKTIISRTRLTLNTSFKQNDILITQLESGNDGGDAIAKAQNEDTNLLGSNGEFVNAGGLDYSGVENNLRLRRLYYTFRPVKDLAVSVGAKMSPRDFIDRNSFANNEARDFSSGFFLNNPLIVQNRIDRNGGAGAAIVWKPEGSNFAVRSLYIAADSSEPNRIFDGGLFGDNRQASVELEYSPSNQLALRLQYTNASINNSDINAFGVNGEYALNRNAGVFARLGYGNYEGFTRAIARDVDLHPWTWSVGLGWRNLLIPGTLAGVAIGQPFVTEDLGNATQTNFEAFYNLELSDNISVTPIFSLVQNADNDRSKDTIWQTTLRTVISF